MKGMDGMKKNECFPMTADRLGADLEGICIHEGMPVFVPGLLPGESADVKIVKAEKRYAFLLSPLRRLYRPSHEL